MRDEEGRLVNPLVETTCVLCINNCTPKPPTTTTCSTVLARAHPGSSYYDIAKVDFKWFMRDALVSSLLNYFCFYLLPYTIHYHLGMQYCSVWRSGIREHQSITMNLGAWYLAYLMPLSIKYQLFPLYGNLSNYQVYSPKPNLEIIGFNLPKIKNPNQSQPVYRYLPTRNGLPPSCLRLN
jgi:hypothetical protein